MTRKSLGFILVIASLASAIAALSIGRSFGSIAVAIVGTPVVLIASLLGPSLQFNNKLTSSSVFVLSLAASIYIGITYFALATAVIETNSESLGAITQNLTAVRALGSLALLLLITGQIINFLGYKINPSTKKL